MGRGKHDYRKEPMVLVAWGLGPGFHARGGAANRRGLRVGHVLLALGAVLAAAWLAGF